MTFTDITSPLVQVSTNEQIYYIKTDVFLTGIVVSLKQLLSDIDATIRHKSTEVLYIISGHASGRDAFLDYEIITPLSKLVCYWSVMQQCTNYIRWNKDES